MLDVLPLLIASLAFLMSVSQYVTRHRPYVCVTAVEALEGTDHWLRVAVQNVGEVPARDVAIQVLHGDETTAVPPGAMFPAQRLNVDCMAGGREPDVLWGMRVHVRIAYRGPLSIGLAGKGYGYHHTFQPLWLTAAGQWWTEPGQRSSFA